MAPHKYSLANGNLHMRHKSRFGKPHLLLALRQWKLDKAAYLSLTREKSEVAMVVKEILDVRGRLNEMNEEMEKHSELMTMSSTRMDRIESMLEGIAMHLKVPLAPAKRLAPLANAPSPSPDHLGEPDRKGVPGNGSGSGSGSGAGAPSGSIRWQWTDNGAGGVMGGGNGDSKVAPISTPIAPVSPREAEDDLLAQELPGLTPGSLTAPTPSRRKLIGSMGGSNTVVPLGRLGALNTDASAPFTAAGSGFQLDGGQ